MRSPPKSRNSAEAADCGDGFWRRKGKVSAFSPKKPGEPLLQFNGCCRKECGGPKKGHQPPEDLNGCSRSQGRVSRRGARHPLSAGEQGDPQGNADGGRPPADPARGRRGKGSRHRAFHLRHRPQQERHRGSFRPAAGARGDACRPRQETRARGASARPACAGRDELRAPAGAARSRPRGMVRPRARRR